MISFNNKWLVFLLAAVILITGCSSTNEVKTKDTKQDGIEQANAKVEEQTAKTEDEATSQTPSEENESAVQQVEPVTIVIDPGHQQKANLEQEPIGPGATETKIKVTGGTTGISTGKPEYVLTLEASKVLGEILEEKGYEVVYTRTTHDVNMSNKERAEIANKHQADLFIRMHADGSTNSSVKGFSILTISNKNPYAGQIYGNSLQAANLILDEVQKDGKIKVNGISYRDDMSGLNWSSVPVVLIEMGFMTNPEEDKNLSDPTYLQYLMELISNGIEIYENGNTSSEQ